MLQAFPFLNWIALITSATLLVTLWYSSELGRRHLAVLMGWWLLAGYVQLFARSAVLAAVGLVLQTMLAIYLLLRARVA